MPNRPKAVRNLDGKFCATPANSLQKWKQHYSTGLNTSSVISEYMIDYFPSHAIHDGMTCVPSLQEVRDALSLIAGSRTGGHSGILPEMVKVCCDEWLVYLIQLFSSVWESKAVPQDWRDALLVPVPKKSDLSLCNKWREISLLYVVGKVFAKVIQQHLQVVVEEVVADSQCGFRYKCGCIDMFLCKPADRKDH